MPGTRPGMTDERTRPRLNEAGASDFVMAGLVVWPGDIADRCSGT
jgi:hypothetical protein